MRRVSTDSMVVAVAVAAAMVANAPAAAGPQRRIPASTGTPSATGPAALISGPVTGGKGIFLLSASPVNLTSAGYRESEYFASGTAHSYVAAGPLGKDGHWQVKPKATASYRTRIVVRVPSDPKKFNGTVLVEWLNVSAGLDAAPDFTYMATELLRSGYAWVGVSAQQVGVSGGGAVVPIPGIPKGGLRGIDPARYGSLHHPGDAYAYDMFSQIGRAIRSPGKLNPLGSVRPQRVVAIGESQSAFELTTYIDAIQPTAHVYDGFFVHSRGGGAIPLAGGNITGGIIGSIRIRDDISVPVFLFETETDEAYLRYFDARQPDNAHLRLWDVAGASHVDAYGLGGAAGLLGCKGEINEAPTHYVVAAALHQLDQWVRTGTPPPSAPRMAVTVVNGAPVVRRGPLGVAIGGVRTAAIDVPVAAYSGVPTSTNGACVLAGSTHPFSAATLTHLYSTPAAYLSAFTNATDTAIAAGYVLPADRTTILADAGQGQVLNGPRALAPSDVGLRGESARLHGVDEAFVVALVLVGVEGGEVGDGAIEGLALAQVRPDRDAIPPTGMGAGKRCSADAGVHGGSRHEQSFRRRCSLSSRGVGARSSRGSRPSKPAIRCQPRKRSVAPCIRRWPATTRWPWWGYSLAATNGSRTEACASFTWRIKGSASSRPISRRM